MTLMEKLVSRDYGLVVNVAQQVHMVQIVYLHKLKATLYENGACWIGARLQRIEEDGGL